ncbi:hypothetical protein VTN00DRAFT_7733 [Thermoascus crustaceus]|uniref:uncharacterized protein n=1 Tax=Thermoascus crustaceus TaxID=5088 RepID=UPI0037436051
MLSASFSALFVLPILVLISIPLILSACITITLSVLTLSLRVSLVYIELFYALITNYFCPAASTTDPSLLTFSTSRSGSITPTTPPSSRAKNRLSSSSPICRFGDSHGSQFQRSSRSRSRNKSRSSRQLLSSGDHDRDVELRTLPPAAAVQRRCRSISGSVVSSSSAYSFNNDEATNERAWLSTISKRLDDLPSHRYHLERDTAAVGAADQSLPSSAVAQHSLTQIQTIASYSSRHIRYHRRSVTTSSLIPSNYLSTRSDYSSSLAEELTREGHRTANANIDVDAELEQQPYNNNFRSQQTESHDGGAGVGTYFSLQRRRRPSSWVADTSGNTSPGGTSVSVEDRTRTSVNIGWSMAQYQYPVGIGLLRRRSSSGATTGLEQGESSGFDGGGSIKSGGLICW